MAAGWARAGRARRCAGGGAEESLLPAVSLAPIRLQAIDRRDSERRPAGVTRIDIPALDDLACAMMACIGCVLPVQIVAMVVSVQSAQAVLAGRPCVGALRNARRSAPSARAARRLESFGCLSEDADVWAIVAGAAVSVWRGAFGRLSLRFGTEIALHSPAVEPGAHPLIGAGGRIGQRFGVATSIDRAPEFTLMGAGFFVGEVPAALYAGIQKSSLLMRAGVFVGW